MTIDPNPDLVESLQERFTKGGEWGVYAYATGWMSAVIVQAAREHAQHCADCQTCHNLSDLLSAVAAVQIINPPTESLDPSPRSGEERDVSITDLAQAVASFQLMVRRRMMLVQTVAIAVAVAAGFLIGITY